AWCCRRSPPRLLGILAARAIASLEFAMPVQFASSAPSTAQCPGPEGSGPVAVRPRCGRRTAGAALGAPHRAPCRAARCLGAGRGRVAAVAGRAGTFVNGEGRPGSFGPARAVPAAQSDLEVLGAIADAMDVHLGLPDIAAARRELDALVPALTGEAAASPAACPGGQQASPASAPPGRPPPGAGQAVLATPPNLPHPRPI